MTLFRPCIDLHGGKVKQIVGGTLSDTSAGTRVNFTSEKPAAWYAEMFATDALTGGHVIMLGPGNETEALSALRHFPGGLQVGGGIHLENAPGYLESGASHVIVTSWVFPSDRLDLGRLEALNSAVGKENLVLDLSCRLQPDGWYVAKNKWQTLTQEKLTPEFLQKVAPLCAELLIHAADVEGLKMGIDRNLVRFLGEYAEIPVTYAGGANRLEDLSEVESLSSGRVDLTIGSALDIFGGDQVKYGDCVAYNRAQNLK